MQDMDKVIDVAQEMKNVKFIGLHFHIGSQIDVYKRQRLHLLYWHAICR